MNLIDELKKIRSSPFMQSTEGVIRKDNAILMHNVLKYLKPKTVIEIGFNQGHGATTVLNSIPKTSNLYCVDIGIHKCAHHNSKLISNKFSNFDITFGDSRKVLNGVCEKIKPIDFAIIDGGHNYAICNSDMKICSRYLSEGGILWMDDYKRIKSKPKENVYRAPGVDRVGDEYRRKLNHFYYSKGGVLILSKRNLDFINDNFFNL